MLRAVRRLPMLIHIGRENVFFDMKREELTNDVILKIL